MGSITDFEEFKRKKRGELVKKQQMVCDCSRRCIMAPCEDAVPSPNFVSFVCNCGSHVRILHEKTLK